MKSQRNTVTKSKVVITIDADSIIKGP